MNRTVQGLCLALCCGLAGTSLGQQGRLSSGGNTFRFVEPSSQGTAASDVRQASASERVRVAQTDLPAPLPAFQPLRDVPPTPFQQEVTEEPVAPAHPLQRKVRMRSDVPLATDDDQVDEGDCDGPDPFTDAPYYGNTEAHSHSHGQPVCGCEAHGCHRCAPTGCKYVCRRSGLIPAAGRGVVKVARGLDCVGQSLDCVGHSLDCVGHGVAASACGIGRLFFGPLQCRRVCSCGGAGCATCGTD